MIKNKPAAYYVMHITDVTRGHEPALSDIPGSVSLVLTARTGDLSIRFREL